MEKEMIYTWRGKNIENLTPEETKQALRDCCRDLIRERAMRMGDMKTMEALWKPVMTLPNL